jgi:hypothetical protein
MRRGPHRLLLATSNQQPATIFPLCITFSPYFALIKAPLNGLTILAIPF